MNPDLEAIIIGGSFAGLAAAMRLRGRRVLIVDQRPIGTHQTSTCATPLTLARAVGAEGAALEMHKTLTLHSAGRAIDFHLREPYITFDYFAFCQAMLAQTDAEVWQAKATGYANGVVSTTAGPVGARFVVDASGWQSLRRQAPPRTAPLLGYGIETELPVRVDLSHGLHFFFEKSVVRNGYAWVFPCGATSRIGVCSFDKGVRLGPVLDGFLARFGLRCGKTHGGAMPVLRREPLVDDLFVVGDAAGQCIPMWAEGIRTAIFYGSACGRYIAGALAGDTSAEEARMSYAKLVRRKAGFQQLMLFLQDWMAVEPEWLRALLSGFLSLPPIAQPLIAGYYHGTGWLTSPADANLAGAHS